MSSGASGLPTWLSGDMARIEGLLLEVAGASKHSLVAEPSTHLINAGGKRLRPALVLLTSHAGEPARRATDLAAAAIELVHLATLYHDDVLDETEVRRGVPTAHSKWGIEVAVLAGDYLFACGSALGADAGGEVPGILARAIAEVCEGQIVETSAVGDPRRAVEDYLETIDKKTGALFRAACDLGASTSGAGEVERAALVGYGTHLGRAFQMVDDLLDLTGDPEVTGKIPGTDLKEGVFTLAVLLACQKDDALASRLLAGDRELSSALPVLKATGGLEGALAEARRAVEAAQVCLERLPEGPWRAAMKDLATSVLAQV
ncbi:MAG: polyprenyl synthetase family protein [Actinomycetota bacterium]